mmetsp:Transcript_65172/g.172666  ORF Transcript_65172/g.172666 Transcript_65172/m.172666 type:complete len:271 (+) Transcript_65172:649-1461(+)
MHLIITVLGHGSFFRYLVEAPSGRVALAREGSFAKRRQTARKTRNFVATEVPISTWMRPKFRHCNGFGARSRSLLPGTYDLHLVGELFGKHLTALVAWQKLFQCTDGNNDTVDAIQRGVASSPREQPRDGTTTRVHTTRKTHNLGCCCHFCTKAPRRCVVDDEGHGGTTAVPRWIQLRMHAQSQACQRPVVGQQPGTKFYAIDEGPAHCFWKPALDDSLAEATVTRSLLFHRLRPTEKREALSEPLPDFARTGHTAHIGVKGRSTSKCCT